MSDPRNLYVQFQNFTWVAPQFWLKAKLTTLWKVQMNSNCQSVFHIDSRKAIQFAKTSPNYDVSISLKTIFPYLFSILISIYITRFISKLQDPLHRSKEWTLAHSNKEFKNTSWIKKRQVRVTEVSWFENDNCYFN